MKTFRLLPLLFSYELFAQIYTPNGTLVPTNSYFTYSNSWPNTNSQLQSFQDDIQNGVYGSSCVVVAGYSRNYNCHGYAWHMYDGGSEIALNEPIYGGVSAYINDGSYAFTSNTTLPKVRVRYTDDHSAVVIYTTNRYLSKWGPGPVVRHSPGDVPWYYGTPNAYYQCNYSSPMTSVQLNYGQTYSGQSYTPIPAGTGSHTLSFTSPYSPTYSSSAMDAGISVTSQSGNTITFNKSLTGGKRILVTRDIGCVNPSYTTVLITDGSYRIAAFPNPASDEISVEVTPEDVDQPKGGKATVVPAKRLKQILLVDGNNQLINKQTISEIESETATANFRFGKVKSGIYYIKAVYSDGSVETKRIMAGRE